MAAMYRWNLSPSKNISNHAGPQKAFIRVTDDLDCSVITVFPAYNYTYVRATLCLIGMSTIFTCDFAFARIFRMGFVASARFLHTFVAGSMINMMR